MLAPAIHRAQLAHLITVAIDMLDMLDGDPDLEPDNDDIDPTDIFGDMGDGPASPILPRYSQDQSAGPINAAEALAVYLSAHSRAA